MVQLLLHLIGDYLLQTDWMAKNKKAKTHNGLYACILHCFVYSLPFFYTANYRKVALICVTHFLIDRWFFVKWYMNTFGLKDFAKAPFAPWSIFLVDNTFHLLCNFAILELVV